MKNYLYYGDNLDVLRKKIRDETIDLCYIDPPFNSKRNYFQIYNNIGSEDRAQAFNCPRRHLVIRLYSLYPIKD
jgi:DNA modification methylase